MSKVDFKHNKEGYFKVMSSEQMAGLLEKYAKNICQIANNSGHAGDNYQVTVSKGKNRANSKVRPIGIHAIKSNRKHNTLLKAMGSIKK